MPPKNVKPAAKSASGSGQQSNVIESSLPSDAANAATSQPLNLDQQVPLGGTAESNNIGGDLTITGSISTLTGSQVQPGTPAGEFAVASEPVPPGAEQSSSSDWLQPSIHGLAVTSSLDGFWRCGRQWTKAETRVALCEFSEDEALRLIQEPMLTVRYIDLAVEEPA
ncbi:MAG: hypothetical protein M3Y65_21710 [Pseudomonadota bacterium]|nr:hypothetical protein [Pseudomonadota bacterium]